MASKRKASALIDDNWKYDVYLSFKGEDTRRSFVSHLYKALASKGIKVFKDDDDLQRGKSIESSSSSSSSLYEAIESSKIAIIVLSENYDASSWCLNELAKIFECKKTRGQIVVPIFYELDPGRYGGAFVKHMITDTRDQVERWSSALKEVAQLRRWEPNNYGDDAALIDDIVNYVEDQLMQVSRNDNFLRIGSSVMELNQPTHDEGDSNRIEMERQLSEMEISYLMDEDCDSNISDMESQVTEVDVLLSDIVGIETQVRELNSILSIEQSDVRMVGIWGVGGIGKTTIAKTIYEKLSYQYDSSCFVENVSDKFKTHGATALQGQLLSSLSFERNIHVESLARGLNLMRERLHNKKVLLVLDDVDHLEQLQILPEKIGFGLGSRIIVTTRDKTLLDAHTVDNIYEVKYLDNDQALQLFCRNAFKQDQPKIEYLELANDIVSYVNGLPLALKVIGCSLYNKSIPEWKSLLQKLKRIPNLDILNILKISYDGLEDTERQVFLDIACFFVGTNKNTVREILDGCGFFTDISFQILMDKGIISFVNDKVFMHELLQQMGYNIVYQESTRPEKRSRLWHHEDVYSVLKQNTGTRNVEGIFLDMSKIKELRLSSYAFSRMHKLRLLKLYMPSSSAHMRKIQLPNGIDFLSDELRYLHWHAYPLRSLPSKFFPEKLVELHLPYSNIEQLWTGMKSLVNLRSLDLSHSKLTSVPDLTGAPNLKMLNLQGCINLIEASSISHLEKLEDLNLKGCRRLRSLPNMDELKSLKYVNLTDCSNLKEFPLPSMSTKYLSLSRTSIQHLPSSIKYLYNLKSLDLRCTLIEEIPSSIASLSSLVSLDLRDCKKLVRLPSSIFELRSLKSLKVFSGLNFLEMVPSLFEYLNLSLSKFLRFSPEYLIELNLEYCNVEEPWRGKQLLVNLRSFKLKSSKLNRVPDLSEAQKLERLDIQGCTNMAEISSIQNLTKLDYLNLEGCENLERLPCMSGLASLITLSLSACSSLKELPELSSSIKYLYLVGMPIIELPSSIGFLTDLVILDLRNCKRLKRLPSSICELTCLEYLNISGCSGFTLL